MKGSFVWIILAFITAIGCQPKGNQESEAATAESDIQFSYQDITGIGKDSIYNRRDNSDVIKVGNTYYVWYTRMDSPVTAGYWGTIWYATS